MRTILATLFTLLTAAPAFAAPKILVVLSSENKITLKDGVVHPTGYFLSELAVPLKALVEAGYEPVFATPKGNAPTMDKVSDSASWFGGNKAEYQAAKKLIQTNSKFKSPLRLSDVVGKEAEYKGLFVPGGHAPMEDLYKDKNLGKILRAFHRLGKVTALICHGPIALLSAGLSDSEKVEWPYKGYKMTSFSTAEEKQEEPGQDNALGGYVQFYPDQALAAAGGVVSVADKWKSNVVRDRELITGQNPMSDKELARAILQALKEKNPSQTVREIPLWDKLRLRVESSLDGVRGNAKDIAKIKASLLAKIRKGEFSRGDLLKPHVLTDVWKKGLSLDTSDGSILTFFIGIAKTHQDRFVMKEGTSDNFLSALQTHLATVNEDIGPSALAGYLVVASQDYEIAVMKWKSAESKANAFAKHASRTNPQIPVLFEDQIVWEDPMVISFQ